LSIRRFKSPALPLPPQDYIDSKAPIDVDGLAMKDLTELPNNLPEFSLYRMGREIKIVLPGDTITTGVASIAEAGSVTVNIS
jgi:hypothetical protein